MTATTKPGGAQSVTRNATHSRQREERTNNAHLSDSIKKPFFSDKLKILSIGLLIFIIGAYLVIDHYYHILSFFSEDKLGSYISDAGIFGPVIYIVIMAIAIIITPIPSLPLAAIAGIIWGPFVGTLYSVLGAEIGAILAFLIARYAGRGILIKVFKKSEVISFNCNEKYLFWIVLITRLFPFFQFDIVSYGAGLTNMKVSKFALATFIGMIPMTYLFTIFGKNMLSGSLALMISSTILIVIGFFVIPALVEKYNLFAFKGKTIANRNHKTYPGQAGTKKDKLITKARKDKNTKRKQDKFRAF